MQILPKLSFKSLALGAAVALVVSTAFAKTYQECQTSCTQIANNYANSARTYYTTQQTNYCNSLTDPAAKSACLAGVPAYADQQAQNVYTQSYNSCMAGCTGA
jgi:hypothetical protein